MIFDFKKGFCDETYIKRGLCPLIGVSANIIEENSALYFGYSDAIINAGGIPLIIPTTMHGDTLRQIVASLDGLVLSGGSDIDARYFGEENIENLCEVNPLRDNYEFKLFRAALDYNLPVLGICRGVQLINVAMGGSIYQDIPSMCGEESLNHSVLENRHLGVHNVEIRNDSELYKILEKETLYVNTIHHQAIKVVANPLKVVAKSPDGIIEAVEGYPIYKILGVQWHPERMAVKGGGSEMEKIFEFIVSEAKLYKRAKLLHNNCVSVDSHCDTPMLYEDGGFDFSIRNEAAKVDVVKMEEGCLDVAMMVAYLPNDTPKGEATDKALQLLDRLIKDVQSNSDKVVIAKDVEGVKNAKNLGLKSIILGIENGLAIGDDILNIDKFNSLGVVYITLCHNGANAICDSAVGKELHGGLSEYGKKVVSQMNKLGVIIDVSHASENTVFDVLRISSKPIIASHSSSKTICNHPRNLSDSAIEEIAKAGGVIQICGYCNFLNKDSEANIFDIIEHIEYVIKLVGYEHVGIGSDFDGGGGVKGFDGANDFINLTIELLRRGHKEEDIMKIIGGNILRILINR